MATRKSSKPRFAICVNNSEYPTSLERHQHYRVLADAEAEKEGDLRIIDESGEDFLCPTGFFASSAESVGNFVQGTATSH